MTAKLSNTAILGPAFYFARVLLSCPYSFNKLNTGSEWFNVNAGLIVLSLVVWKTLFLPLWYLGTPSYYINITNALLYPVVFRKRILHCFNVAYSLLRLTKHSHPISFPLLFIFSPIVFFCILHLTVADTSDYFVTVILLPVFAVDINICSLCFSASFIFRDIGHQLEDLNRGCLEECSSMVLQDLAKMQERAHHLSSAISRAFGLYLLVHVLWNTADLVYLVVTLSIGTHFKRFVVPLTVCTCSLVVLSVSSYKMNNQASGFLLTIQELISKTDLSDEVYNTLAAMMSQAKLVDTHVSVQDCFTLDLSLIFTAANVFTTFLIVLLEVNKG